MSDLYPQMEDHRLNFCSKVECLVPSCRTLVSSCARLRLRLRLPRVTVGNACLWGDCCTGREGPWEFPRDSPSRPAPIMLTQRPYYGNNAACKGCKCIDLYSPHSQLLREGSPTDTAIPAARDHLADPDTLFGHVQNISFHLVSHHKALASLRGQLGSIVQERSGHGQATTAAVEALGSELAQSLAATQQQLVALEGRVEGLRSGQDKNRVEELQRTVRGQTERIARLEGSLESLRQQSERQSWQLERAGGGGGGGLKGGGGGLKGGEVVRAEVGTEVGERSRMAQLEGKIEEVERQNALLKVHMSELELQLQASLASTHNGAFLWRIPEVSRRKRDALEERITSIYSPPFYTGRNGYKMCIRAYLNGDGIGLGTYLSIFFVLMKGEYDPLLKWPFENKVSLILVDQNHRKHIVQTFKPTPESSSFQRPRADMNVASGCPQFSKLSVLDDKNYVKEDVMYIKCIVDTSRIFHP